MHIPDVSTAVIKTRFVDSQLAGLCDWAADMKPDPKKLIDEAVKLEPASRPFVKDVLLGSRDLEPDVEVSEERPEEIHRRCAASDQDAAALTRGAHIIAELRTKCD